MIAALAFLEGTALATALAAAILGWSRAHVADGMGEWQALALIAALAAATLAALYYADAYELHIVPTTSAFVGRLPRCLAFAAAPVAAAYVWWPEIGQAAAVAVGATIALLPLLRAPFYHLLRRGLLAERVLLIGTGALARRVMEAVEREAFGRCAIVGIVDDELDAEDSYVPVDERLGPLSALERIIEATAPDRIVVALEERRRRLPVRPLLEAKLRGVLIEDSAAFYERWTGKIAFEALTPSSLIFSQDYRTRRITRLVGRTVSVLVALAGLLVSLPLMGAIAVAIRLDSPGPVFFVQERVGRRGRRFSLMKFRTMHEVDRPHTEWAGDNADRVTRLGRWLRRFRLDELPQFINVLRGDMELVGPRPHPVSNFSLFVTILRNSPECGVEIPYYSLRSMVRPGITGWAQVRYRYANNLAEEIEKMRYDLYYVKHRSIWLDLRILADTVKTVVAGREALDQAASAPAATAAGRWPAVSRAQ